MGLFGNLFGGAQMKQASRKARDAQLTAMDSAMGTLNSQYATTAGNYAPYQAGGTAAFRQYGDLLGLNGGDVQGSAIEALRNSPYFKSLYGQGQEAVLQNASATGGLRGGNTEHSLYDLGEQTLAQTIQQQLSNLGGTANTFGMGSNNALGQFGANNANAIAGLQTGEGQARAQDLLTRGSINNSLWSGIGSTLLNAGMMAAGLPPGMASGLTGGGGGGLLGANSAAVGGGGGFNMTGLLQSIFGGGSAIPSPDLGSASGVNVAAPGWPTSLSSGDFTLPGLAG